MTDTGIGIASENHQKIFAEFYQIRSGMRKPEGTGLGLALAKKFVELHGGRIWVESQVGQGSTFTFTLPMRVAVEKPATAVPEPGAAQVGRPVALVVEDDTAAAKLLSIYLTEAWFSVEVAADGEVGLQRAHDLRPAIITLDILIPKLDGWDVIQRVKSARPAVSVIITSGYVDPEFKTKLLETGVKDFLDKPYTIKAVLNTLQQILEKSGRGKTSETGSSRAESAALTAGAAPQRPAGQVP